MQDDDLKPTEPLLSRVEARIIGCLMEKQRTTPDQYPLTLNALVAACNQKTSRHPVMQLTPGEVGHAVNVLRDRGLIHASFSGRTERYDHKLAGTYLLDRRQLGLLCALMLRGPQTPGELRTNAARLADLPDLATVHEALDSLVQHEPPLARELPRQSGAREQRFAHLLCGEPEIEATAPAIAAKDAGDRPAFSERLEQLEQRVSALEAELATLKGEQT
ncbi:MAG: YceH family protein [Thiohalocapsa sp.]|uniref:YceH family protein n=1 Tax=Thiohalocapsa sp. TaxID=2497641 RepID=UPI0025DA1DFD|nr:YceH family protein [Thiohalocapsa sp.]MCG6939829.1 YceH family protein [Thiohalocapsa sp.]